MGGIGKLEDRFDAPNWLIGLWRREVFESRDGTIDRTTQVFWGQTRNLFVDLRIPKNRPKSLGRRGFEDFTREELSHIAEQYAFAGHVVVEGDRCTWIRHIDYQPNTGRPDTARLQLEGDKLHEDGNAESVVGAGYHEVYRRAFSGEKRRLALRLDACDGTPFGGRPASNAILVVLDDRFMFARARPSELDRSETLLDLVMQVRGDRTTIESYLDCEVSIGRLGNDESAWKIERSTLPWREGQRLFLRGHADFEPNSDRLRLDTPMGQAYWQVTDTNLPRDSVCETFKA